MLALDQLGDGVDLVRRERDDRGPSRLARDLAVAGEFQLRESRSCDDGGARQQPLDDRPHGGRAEQHGLVAAAPVQHAVGENVPAFEIGGDLDFVNGEERHVDVARHRLHGGDPEARRPRLDLLLAGDQRDRVDAGARGDLVVDLARQQAQRQADDARRMREQALDRQMRLAGVGRPEHGGDARAGSALVGMSEWRKGHMWRVFLFRTLVVIARSEASGFVGWVAKRTHRFFPRRHGGLRFGSPLRFFAPHDGLNSVSDCDVSRHDMGCEAKLRNDSGTKGARIADSKG